MMQVHRTYQVIYVGTYDKSHNNWSESQKRTWAVYSFFRSVDSKAVEEVVLTIGIKGHSKGSSSTHQSDSQNPTASLKADANEVTVNVTCAPYCKFW